MPVSLHSSHCSPLDEGGPCGALPPGFFRLRYFFGKRLGVADFVDEQRYHAGKMRFHNRHLHGSGVLCGLGASLMEAGATVLRIGKGAALDSCGHEIVVGHDQCIDVDAWFRLEREQREDPWPSTGELDLCVVLRYRECATSPEAAPRDPCSCDVGGCDYGRVREEFELVLFEASEVATFAAPAVFPEATDRLNVMEEAIGGGALADSLSALIRGECPEPREDDWLVLARFNAILNTDRTAVDAITNIATTGALWPASLLQELLRRNVAATLESGSLADGPQVAGVGLEGDVLVLSLSSELVGATVTAGSFALRMFDPTSTATPWNPAPAVTSTYVPGDATRAPAIQIAVDGPWTADAFYRLALVADPAEPIVDSQMRPLRPLRFSLSFKVVENATTGALEIAPAPFAA